MFVSVIIPTYNRGFELKETINSVLSQTYSDFEIIIVDDGSTDNTADIVGSYDNEKIHYYIIKHSGLPSVARNYGIKQSNGELLAFLDSDDLWIPTKLEIQINFLINNPEFLGIASNVIFFPTIVKTKVINNNIIVNFYDLLKEPNISNSSVIIRREIIDKIGYLDENPALKAIEDYDYWLRILF